MRRTRTRQSFVWPALAALIVSLIMIGSQKMRERMGFIVPSPQHHADAQPKSLPEWLRPQALVATDDTIEPSTLHRVTPQDREQLRTRELGATQADGAKSLSNLLPPPDHVADGTLLRAPIRDPREELAGLLRDTLLQSSSNLNSTIATNGNLLPSRNRDLEEWDLQNETARKKNRVPALLASVRSPVAVPETTRVDRSISREPASSPNDLTDPASQRERVHTFDDQSTLRVTIGTATSIGADAETGVAPSFRQRNPESGETPLGIAWPLTPQLEESLKLVESDAALAVWIQEVRFCLNRLQSLSTLALPEAGEWIGRLMELGEEGLEYGETLANDRDHGQQMLRTSHAILRRAVIWQAVWSVAAEGANTRLNLQTVSLRSLPAQDLSKLIASLDEAIEQTGDADGWRNYLLLGDLESAASSGDNAERKLLAQRLLSRVQWEGLDEDQREWIDRPELHRLLSAIQPWSEGPVDYVSLLAQLERLESDATDLGSINVAGAVQDLRFSDNESVVSIAKAINNYYRNANIRMAVSAKLLEQLLPEVPQRTTAIRQRLVGVPVQGTGVVNTEMKLQLVPTEGAWAFQLQTLGSIRSKTGSEQWPARFTNQAQSRFTTTTPVQIERRGMRVGDTEASVQSDAQLRSLQTEFDGLPLISSLVRSIAIAQYNERKGLAKTQSDKLVRTEIESSVAGELEKELDQVSSELSSRLIGPLGNLKLDPLVVDLDTTETRLSARYRIAGDWQVAANTPRPRALARSLLSLQVHQSAINNTLEQLVGGNDLEPIDQLFTRIADNFGVPTDQRSNDLPSDVAIRFTATRPITVEFKDNSVWLTFRILRLKRERGVDLTRFMVRAQYTPVIDGMNTRLERTGVLLIDGPSMGIRERLPVRAIFEKVLNPNRTMPLIAPRLATHPVGESLTVGLLELTDGWIGLSVCEKDFLQNLEGDTAPMARDRLAEQYDNDTQRPYNR